MENIHNIVAKHGARKIAIHLIDLHIRNNFGMGKSDLPDTAELCEIVDELEEHLNSDVISKNTINEIVGRIDMDFIQELVFS